MRLCARPLPIGNPLSTVGPMHARWCEPLSGCCRTARLVRGAAPACPALAWCVIVGPARMLHQMRVKLRTLMVRTLPVCLRHSVQAQNTGCTHGRTLVHRPHPARLHGRRTMAGAPPLMSKSPHKERGPGTRAGARLHGGHILGGRHAVVVEAQPLLHLLLHALAEHRCRHVLEAVDPGARIVKG